jgi:hypothetical protein
VIGPTVVDRAVTLAEIRTVDELPAGVGDDSSQDATGWCAATGGSYDFAVGPTSPSNT